MAETDPSYCPTCGGPLRSLPRGVEFRCADCGERTFLNPAANARVVVVDAGTNSSDAPEATADRLLLTELADSGRLTEPPHHDSEWGLPGGHLEMYEQPPEAAARELQEETGLVVTPEALVPFGAVTRWAVPEKRSLVVFYAVDREHTDGSLQGADDASDVRFWAPGELAEAEGRRFRELQDGRVPDAQPATRPRARGARDLRRATGPVGRR